MNRCVNDVMYLLPFNTEDRRATSCVLSCLLGSSLGYEPQTFRHVRRHVNRPPCCTLQPATATIHSSNTLRYTIYHHEQ